MMRSAEFQLLTCRAPGTHAVRARSRRAFARHMHDQFGIGVIESGGQLSLSGRGQVEAGPGDVITVNPGEVHDGSPIGDDGRSWRILYFDPAVVDRAAEDIWAVGSGGFELDHPVLRDPRAADLARRLFDAAIIAPGAMRHEELLLATVAALGGQHRRVDRGTPTPAVAIARAMIDDDPAAPVTLAELAAASGLGRFQLLRSFARSVGLTPHAYLVQRRVEAARRLIVEGAALADAAAATGFADQSHMTRAFTRRFGLTPGAYAAARR